MGAVHLILHHQTRALTATLKSLKDQLLAGKLYEFASYAAIIISDLHSAKIIAHEEKSIPYMVNI